MLKFQATHWTPVKLGKPSACERCIDCFRQSCLSPCRTLYLNSKHSLAHMTCLSLTLESFKKQLRKISTVTESLSARAIQFLHTRLHALIDIWCTTSHVLFLLFSIVLLRKFIDKADVIHLMIQISSIFPYTHCCFIITRLFIAHIWL